MKKKIPYGRQFINKKNIKDVSKSLRDDLITTGNYVKKFEKKISDFLKVKYVATCSNGTSALHLSFLASGIKKNDIIIMPIVNFIASYSMCKLLGAKIYFADIDSRTGQITPKTILKCIKNNKLKKIKALVVQFMGGYPENNYEFYKLKKKLKCLLIEDSCHAFGAKYNHKNKLINVGSCKHSDLATFSFHPLKPITTGEGGCVTTNNKNYFDKIIKLRSHGIIVNNLKHWEYDVKYIGYNYRLSDINCSLGVSQLDLLKNFINKRKKIYDIYKSKLDGYKNKISFPNYTIKNCPTYHLVIVNIEFKKQIEKNNFLQYLKNKNIFCQYHYIPLNKFSIIREKSEYDNSKKYFLNALSIPIFHGISIKQTNYIINAIKNYFN